MLSIAAGTRIFFAAGSTDMRKGFDGPCQAWSAEYLNKIPCQDTCSCLSIVVGTS